MYFSIQKISINMKIGNNYHQDVSGLDKLKSGTLVSYMSNYLILDTYESMDIKIYEYVTF